MQPGQDTLRIWVMVRVRAAGFGSGPGWVGGEVGGNVGGEDRGMVTVTVRTI